MDLGTLQGTLGAPPKKGLESPSHAKRYSRHSERLVKEERLLHKSLSLCLSLKHSPGAPRDC